MRLPGETYAEKAIDDERPVPILRDGAQHRALRIEPFAVCLLRIRRQSRGIRGRDHAHAEVLGFEMRRDLVRVAAVVPGPGQHEHVLAAVRYQLRGEIRGG